jgi:hypothetical protein
MASNLALGSLGHEARWEDEEDEDEEDEYEDDGGTWDLSKSTFSQSAHSS